MPRLIHGKLGLARKEKDVYHQVKRFTCGSKERRSTLTTKRNKPKRVTINDVAREAGVSATTVSFVLSDKPGVSISPESRQRVREAARTLGYRGNAAARSLASQRTELIGVVTDIVSSPFAGDAITAGQDTAAAKGFQTLISSVSSVGEIPITDAPFRTLLSRQVEGLLVIFSTNLDVSLPASASEAPCVVVNSTDSGAQTACVLPDEVRGGYEATKWLIDAGHQRIGMINLEAYRPAAAGRQLGYCQALEEASLPVDASLILDGRADADHGYTAATLLLSRRQAPTAIFCATDRIAMGAYDAIKERGLKIPDDISVVGFDDQQLISQHLRPPLSTMRLPFKEMTETAVGMLVNSLDDHTTPSGTVLCRCEPVERASVAPPAATTN